jgi:RimJ/RimL family protein N-acetyltransferase
MDELIDASLAGLPSRRCLEGRLVTVVPLDVAEHAGALYEGTHGEGSDLLWRFMGDGPFGDRDSFERSLSEKAASEDPLFFAIVDHRSGLAAGYASYLRITPQHRVIEVGNIVFARCFQKTAGATEAMYLMARYVFEDLDYRRYEWKCNALHSGSRRAAARLGFRFEGIFRQHMIVKNRNRDTAWFSMLDSEWPDRKATFERWLDPSNFDGDGRQKESLSTWNVG